MNMFGSNRKKDFALLLVELDLESEKKENERLMIFQAFFNALVYEGLDDFYERNKKNPSKIIAKYISDDPKKQIAVIATKYGHIQFCVDSELDCLLKVE